MAATNIKVVSPNVAYTEDYIESSYVYETTKVQVEGNSFKATPCKVDMTIRTQKKVPKLGVMLVGWGGNNGTTVTAAILANKNKMTWETRRGMQEANYYGSLTQATTISLGTRSDGSEVYVPFHSLVPMVDPNNIVLDGWDISKMDLGRAMERARVLDPTLLRQLYPRMEKLVPRPSIYDPGFIAANQLDRADNLIKGTKWEQMMRIREDIQDFKAKSGVDKVIILWTANTERFSEIKKGLNDTEENLMNSIKKNEKEISPSSLFAVASILEKCAYINGSPQNTFVPGLLEMAARAKVFIAGDDFKSGQTKIKSVLVDFLVSAGMKPSSIVSYNHLGNNDGKNLSSPAQFRSKEISKSNVVDDMVLSNGILYKPGEHPDHCVVIKYVPYVGDSKRALDEYTSEIMMGGTNTIVLHNTCEDSLLASPIILDLVILTEVCQRISFRTENQKEFQTFHSVLSVLSYLCKAPLVPPGAPVVNALFKQRACLENMFRACIGLPPVNHLHLEQRLCQPEKLSFAIDHSCLEEIASMKLQSLSNGVIRKPDSGHCSSDDETNVVAAH